MEIGFAFLVKRTGSMVCCFHDNSVRLPSYADMNFLTTRSIICPWVTLREVDVEVEIVSFLVGLSRNILIIV